jgi:hypothetical protein
MANKTVTIRPSGGDYTTLDAANTGELLANANLTAAGMDGILTFQPSGDWSAAHDTARVTMAGFTVDAAHYWRIVPDSSNFADGVWDDTKYVLSHTPTDWYQHTLYVTNRYAQIKGVQVENLSDANNVCTALATGDDGRDMVIDRCITKGGDCGMSIRGRDSTIVNCTIAGYRRYGIARNGDDPGNTYFYNDIVCGGTQAGSYGFYVDRANTNIKNCYAGGNGTGGDYSETTAGFIVDTTSYSEDGTCSTPTAAYSTDTFTSVTAGSEDFTLVSGSDLIGEGTDLSADAVYPFDWDAAGATRTTWDIGTLYFPTSTPSVFGQICIGGAWKTIDTVSVCIGASWKNVTEIQIVNTNAWKALTT